MIISVGNFDHREIPITKQMTHQPLLSICIPAYNRPLWFRRALESIAISNERFASSVEIIITDDSDVPECEEIVKQVCGNGDVSGGVERTLRP